MDKSNVAHFLGPPFTLSEELTISVAWCVVTCRHRGLWTFSVFMYEEVLGAQGACHFSACLLTSGRGLMEVMEAMVGMSFFKV